VSASVMTNCELSGFAVEQDTSASAIVMLDRYTPRMQSEMRFTEDVLPCN
jgi:hypothetical protein